MQKTAPRDKGANAASTEYNAKLGPGLSHHKDLRIGAQYFRKP
jgi:hypothetical protein